MPAYIVALVDITNPAAYDEYRKLAGPAMLKYGGKFLARGGRLEVLEGKFAGGRVVVAEYPTIERAKEFYNSPEYTEARAKRAGAADMLMLVVEGT